MSDSRISCTITNTAQYEIDLDVAPLVTEVRIYADSDGHFTIPPEYRSDVVYGPNVKAMAVELYSEDVMATERIVAFLDAAGGNVLGLSTGSVYHFCRSFSEKSQGSVAYLEEELLNHRAVMTDATVVSVNGKQGYIRNFSMEKAVVYRVMKDKTIGAMKKLRFWRNLQESLCMITRQLYIILGRVMGNATPISSDI